MTAPTLLQKYVDAVLHAPDSLCLTATKDPKEYWERHVLDALQMLTIFPPSQHQTPLRMIDVGSGNGVPGLVAAIACPAWDVFLLDSNNKKCGFLDVFCKHNNIQNVHVRAGRAEVAGHEQGWRDSFQLVLSRALCKLPIALELCTPFLSIGGKYIVSHGTSYKEELKASEKAMRELNIHLEEVRPYKVIRNIIFNALIFGKDHPTPDCYPRKTGLPAKKPL